MTQARQVCRWHAQPDVEALERAVVAAILHAAQEALALRGAFRLVLAGGSTPQRIYRALRGANTDWNRWHIYFGDERCLPPDDGERNSRMAAAAWLDHVTIPPAQIHPIPAELGAREAAAAYVEQLVTVGEFDLVLLGLGEDGHTASLFPGHDWGTAPAAPDALAVFDAPKPPPQRVSLGARRLGVARQVVFVVSGEGKRPALAEWQEGKQIPAASISPVTGVDIFFS
ncbi:MAG: 6-phosphogluconolactonase [Gammaproteobacteria bacterium]|nr:6-phosphogluconolactonase [Gammaproteobacteria bacterium]MBU1646699.1 6-phosphogluconolactonase [Gammaproteobacteria bacterium]MBU1971732.1 6-phosphogluconolactonase [Gammaproteobacteria bacterium]